MRRQPVFSPNLWWRCLTLGASRKCPGSAAVNNDSKSKAMPVVFSRHNSAVPLTRTTRNSGHAVQLEWPAAAARHAQLLAASAAAEAKLWAVTGHSTPNLADVGGASVRLRHLGGEGNFLPDGGYLLGIRVAREGAGWLPAIAGVPGDRGPDDHGSYRRGLAELMVFGRPLDQDGEQGPAVTTLHEEALAQLMPVGSQVDAVVLERVTDFFLGLNAGQWLKIRLGQISDASLEFLGKQHEHQQQQQQTDKGRIEDGCAHAQLLEGTGLDLLDGVEPPPPDSRHKFEVGTSFVRSVDDWSRARVD